jgi:hypothetical protein
MLQTNSSNVETSINNKISTILPSSDINISLNNNNSNIVPYSSAGPGRKEYGLPCPKDKGEEAFSPPDPKGERRRGRIKQNILFCCFVVLFCFCCFCCFVCFFK